MDPHVKEFNCHGSLHIEAGSTLQVVHTSLWYNSFYINAGRTIIKGCTPHFGTGGNILRQAGLL